MRIRNAFGVKLDPTLDDALMVFQQANIPSVIIGGYAVQEHGYFRTTEDIDIVVLDVSQARQALVFSGHFKKNQGSNMTVTHKDTKVEIDLLKGGTILSQGGKVPLPKPRDVGRNIVSLSDLIKLKLDSYATQPVARSKDQADVVGLIQKRQLPRDFISDPAYEKLWDALQEDLKKR